MLFGVLKKSLTAMAERVGELSESSDDTSASYDVLYSESITSSNRLLNKALLTSIRFHLRFPKIGHPCIHTQRLKTVLTDSYYPILYLVAYGRSECLLHES